MFDEDAFMSSTSEGEMSTEFTPVPVGEYSAVVKKVGTRSGEGEGEKGSWAMLDVTWAIDDAGVTEITGMDNPSVRQSIFLDITESGGLDYGKGKNIGLGRLREALGQNTGAAWSPSMLEGNVATVLVDHRLYEGRTFADVKNVSAI